MQFEFEFTLEKLNQIIPDAKYGTKTWFKELQELLPLYGIKTLNSVSAFMVETYYESNGYMIIEESLNYNERNLLTVWPNKFNEKTAKAYAKNAEAIANRVYANRMGNDSEESGDGWKYRARGVIPITGKSNYTKFAVVAGMNDDEVINYLQTPRGIIHAACWIWKSCDLNLYAEREDIIGISNRLTKGMIGVEAKETNFKKIKEILC